MKASLIALAVSLGSAAAAHAAEGPHDGHEIVVTAHHADDRIDLPPATRATVDAEAIATKINALSAEDALKYAPSLVVRKRHVGDNFAPIATRTSGLGSSARSLIYADGVLLSAFIANNNGNGSPRWNLVAPEEIARVDVLYGPFSAAYPGNAIGTAVNITTRLPDRLEASFKAAVSVQTFEIYGTRRTLPTWQVSATLGDRIGPLSLFAAITRTDAKSQPVSVVTVPGHGNGGFDGLNRTSGKISVVGVGGLEHHVQYTGKLKAALDLGKGIRLSYLFGLWTDDTDSTVESYLRNATGAAVYPTGFNSQVYFREASHTAHAITLEGSSPHFDWHLVATSYRYDRDLQSGPAANAVLPAALAGGSGTVQRLDGTGWVTLDAKAAWRPKADDSHVISFGAHADRYTLASQTNAAVNWLDPDVLGAATSASRGRTRTLAVWVQDRIALTDALALTLGGRQEWWRAWDGFNLAAGGRLVQPERRFSAFSPKASLEWRPAEAWRVRASFGQAWRFPTVGELYQVTTVGALPANPNPNLRPERARSAELAIERRLTGGSVRLSLFNEIIDDALISQAATIPGTTQVATFVQNVDRTRARGVELAIDRRDFLPGLDLQGSVTYADARTVRNTAFPASVGKLLPSVPQWKANAVLTWRPDERWSLTGAARFASRNWGTLDNSDVIGNTWQGFYKYFVVDLRATYKASERLTLGVGVDNLTNDKYFLFHPFPQRSFTADVKWKL